MTDKQKELINKATKKYRKGIELEYIYVIPSERLYNGPWIPTTYEHMILIGETIEGDHYLISNDKPDEDIDVLTLFLSRVIAIDIPHEYDSVRLCFENPIVIDECLSSISPKAVDHLEALEEDGN